MEAIGQQRRLMQVEHNYGVVQHELNLSVSELKKARASVAMKDKELEEERNSFATVCCTRPNFVNNS